MECNRINDLKVNANDFEVKDEIYGKFISQTVELKGTLEDGAEVEISVNYTGPRPSSVLSGLDRNSRQNIFFKTVNQEILTGENLLSFGFIQENNKYTLTHNSFIIHLVDYHYSATGDDFHIGFIFKWGEFVFQKQDRVIKYIHELEDLVYVLTGQALSIK